MIYADYEELKSPNKRLYFDEYRELFLLDPSPVLQRFFSD